MPVVAVIQRTATVVAGVRKKRKGRPSRPRRSAACSTVSRGAGCGLTVTGSSKAASYSADAGFTCARR